MKIENKIIVFGKECSFCGRHKTIKKGKKIVFQYKNPDGTWDTVPYCTKTCYKANHSMTGGV